MDCKNKVERNKLKLKLDENERETIRNITVMDCKNKKLKRNKLKLKLDERKQKEQEICAVMDCKNKEVERAKLCSIS